MPRLNERFHTCAFFLYARSPKTGELVGPCGTGVLVGLPRSDRPTNALYVRHIYAVTCHHVAVEEGASVIRLNAKGRDGTIFIDLEPHDWVFDPRGDDIAVADVTEHFVAQGTGRPSYAEAPDFTVIPAAWMATRDFVTGYKIGIGEDGFMLGLLSPVAGHPQNVIAARFGNISVVAQDDILIGEAFGRQRPAHIFDMKSRSGFSGSPVFVYRTPDGDLRDANSIRFPRHHGSASDMKTLFRAVNDLQQISDRREEAFIRMLGVHVGQYRDEIEARKARVPEADRSIQDGDRLYIPNSLTIVAPAWSVLDLIERDSFAERRADREVSDPVPAILPEPKPSSRPAAAAHVGSAFRRPPTGRAALPGGS
jgi:hypothetical protein